MSENEKKILQTISEALPNMSERDKGYFLGYSEALASQKEGEHEDDKSPVGSDRND